MHDLARPIIPHPVLIAALIGQVDEERARLGTRPTRVDRMAGREVGREFPAHASTKPPHELVATYQEIRLDHTSLYPRDSVLTHGNRPLLVTV